ncbi:type I polyketide synthase [Streptomyces ziwulingensis]|uniref:Uncharacterized protein n=1 Tax=Streptomyces ziwulingensis TaxID=1045501 RepID=A0ABP9CEI8_9ACTN
MTANDSAHSRGAVAVIGMAGRFPGSSTVEGFWHNLVAGTESLTALDDRRSSRQPEYRPAYGLLTDAAAFDAEYFGYSPQEALITDPQQRQTLECAHEALERAGHGASPRRPTTGVFVGGSHTRYGERVRARLDEMPFIDAWQVAHGNDADFLSSRVAYKLGLTGPAVTVLSACSTSLVAVHLAVRSLLDGECAMALAGGASVLPEAPSTPYVPGGVIAPDGHCRPFDAAAAGTVGAGAVGLVVLRPLADALAAGDHVHAVILGSAVNNDGRDKLGFTAPSVPGQAAAVRAAHRAAGVTADEVGYVEAHGTATPLGDPVEVAALTAAFRESTELRGYCRIGSVKGNLGHADAAAGVVGLIKTVLAVEHGVLPASLHFDEPNPDIDFESTPFRVNATTVPWRTPDGRPRVAGVNSLGLGGTNAHVVVAQAPAGTGTSSGRPHQLLLVSGRTPAAADRAASRLATHFEDHPATDLADAAWTLRTGRTHHTHRRFAVAGTAAEAAAALRAGGPAGGQVERTEPVPVFLFAGQGGQRTGMARDLYEHEPVFRRHLDEICELAADPLGLDLRAVLFPDGERGCGPASQHMNSIAVGQPAVFAVQYAQARLLMSWGVRPAAVAGHSLGAYAAACLAGVFALPDAVHLVVERGRLLGSLPAGAMAAVSLPEEAVTRSLPAGLSVGAVNGPGQCTVSGPAALVADYVRAQRDRAVQARMLRIATAGHSPLVEPVLARFADFLAGTAREEARLPMISDTTGEWADPGALRSVEYWVRHLRRPVRFGQVLGTLSARPGTALVDIGPGRTLSTLARQHPDYHDGQLVVHTSPHPAEATSGLATLLGAVGRLWSHGAHVDLGAPQGDERRRRVPLPTYPFERTRFLVPAVTSERPDRAPRPLGSWIDPPRVPEASGDRAEAAGGTGGPGTGAERDGTGAERDVLEAVLGAFGKALGIPDVAGHDGFLDLGGDSLVATRLAAWATAEFQVSVSAADILKAATAASLARLIQDRTETADTLTSLWGAGAPDGSTR